MAQSKCPKCDNTTFESKRVKMVDGKNEFLFIQCAKCGCVVGISDTTSLKNVGNAILQELQRPHFQK